MVTRRIGISAEAAREVIGAGGKLGHFQLVRLRVRWFTEGAALGSESFLVRVLGAAGDRAKPRTLPVAGAGGKPAWFSLSRLKMGGVG